MTVHEACRDYMLRTYGAPGNSMDRQEYYVRLGILVDFATERAAIMEYDGGLPRERAEEMAMREVVERE